MTSRLIIHNQGLLMDDVTIVICQQSFPWINNLQPPQSAYATPLDLPSASSHSHGLRHPYAFVGIPGMGTGAGWESLWYNTGHFMSHGHEFPAVVTALISYDFRTRHYFVGQTLHKSASWWQAASPPLPGTSSSPIPKSKTPPRPIFTTLPQTPYTPYIATLRQHLPWLLEANETTLPVNYGFVIVAGQRVVSDPRPDRWKQSALDGLWGGRSMRYYQGQLITGDTRPEDRQCWEVVRSKSTGICGIEGDRSSCCEVNTDTARHPSQRHPRELAVYSPHVHKYKHWEDWWNQTRHENVKGNTSDMFSCGVGISPNYCPAFNDVIMSSSDSVIQILPEHR
eukprot:GHVQ01039350.1.p1 GENE.GHVQ01039350.1~~GHVQ01039350.1.p1  ORF type:complete len:339 (-),score=35.00 GHVQ01039350.1:190-1206(-)